MPGSKIKAIVFDIGGVLLRTEDHSSRRKLEQIYELPVGSVETFVFDSEPAQASIIGLVEQKAMWISVAERLSLSQEAVNDFENSFWAGDRWDAELLEFLQKCRPEFTTALLSNAWKGFRHVLAESFGILEGQAVDHILLSSELGVAKPDPQIYNILANTVMCGYDEILFVDDNLDNITAANALGIQTIHFGPGINLINEIKSSLAK